MKLSKRFKIILVVLAVVKMSSYTITLKEVVDLYAMDEASNNRDKIELARTKLFDFDYPIYDENYRKDFETHFIRNFYMREIGTETEGLFKFNLETWLIINMPYWNKVFESELITFDALSNTNITSTHDKTNDVTGTSKGETKGSSNGTNNTSNNGSLTENDFNRKLESNTPDSRLEITASNGTGVIEYASNIEEDSTTNSKTSNSSGSQTTNDTTDVTSTGSNTSNQTEKLTETRSGKVGEKSYSKMLTEYRETFLRIEKDIFKEMNQLFMLVY